MKLFYADFLLSSKICSTTEGFVQRGADFVQHSEGLSVIFFVFHGREQSSIYQG